MAGASAAAPRDRETIQELGAHIISELQRCDAPNPKFTVPSNLGRIDRVRRRGTDVLVLCEYPLKPPDMNLILSCVEETQASVSHWAFYCAENTNARSRQSPRFIGYHKEKKDKPQWVEWFRRAFVAFAPKCVVVLQDPVHNNLFSDCWPKDTITYSDAILLRHPHQDRAIDQTNEYAVENLETDRKFFIEQWETRVNALLKRTCFRGAKRCADGSINAFDALCQAPPPTKRARGKNKPPAAPEEPERGNGTTLPVVT